jgi:periplasmic protein TonB
MLAPNDQQRWLTSWGVSVLLHAGLLVFGIAWLLQPARFHVKAGETSTEINLAIEPAPNPALIPPPRLSPPTPPPLPLEQPTPSPKPVQPVLAVKPVAIFTPSAEPMIDRAKPPSAKTSVVPKSSHVHEASSETKGAIKAQPDDLHNEPPEYPEESRIAGEQGAVILQVQVTAAGEPARVAILKSSGFFRLDQAARHAVEHWKFHPGMLAGIPVPSEADVPVHFKLQ